MDRLVAFDDEYIWFSAEELPGSKHDTFATGDPGTRGIGTPTSNLKAAVDLLVESVGVERLRKLKIRSGEHLAAIVTTCFLRTAPTNLDDDGGVDLVFDDFRASGWHLKAFSPKPPAFEVKSLDRSDGGYRKWDSRTDRIWDRGSDPSVVKHVAVFFTANQVLDFAAGQIEKAESQIVRKTSDRYSRNVFVVVHFLDYSWVEVFSLFLAAHLKPLTLSKDIDSVWVLWVPDEITVWSSNLNDWLNFKFGSLDPNKGSADDVDNIQDAEQYFFERIGYSGGSPFVWDFKSSDNNSD
jgi:hypothetical protein